MNFPAFVRTMDICDGSPDYSQLCSPDLLARTVDICATLAKVEATLIVLADCKHLLLIIGKTHRAALESPTPSRLSRLLMRVNDLMVPCVTIAITWCLGAYFSSHVCGSNDVL
jgi:hypothetical protein